MDVLGTKSLGEREDEEAERLVRPLPKKKPPRHDRRRERMDTDRDPDLHDEDVKRDPDLSLNRKNVGGSVNLARIARNHQEADKVKVRRKEDGKIVDVSKDTLKERGGEYEVYKPNSKWEQEAGDFAGRIKNDPALESRLKKLLDPTSDTGGIAEGNPAYPASVFEKDLPASVKTLGDLKELAQEVFSRPKEKPKKAPKKEAPVAAPVEEPAAKAGPEGPTAPEPKGDAKTLPPPNVQKIISDLTKVLTKQEPAAPAKKPKAPPAKSPEAPAAEVKPESPAPAQGAPEAKPEAKPETPESGSEAKPEQAEEEPKGQKPEKKPKAEKKPKGEEPKEPVRRVPSREELFEARQLVIDTFPPNMAAKFITMHPDDINELISNYHDLKVGSMTAADAAKEIAKSKDWSLDPEKIEPPEKVTVAGKEVPLSELSPEHQAEEVQKHRMGVVAARLAVRSQAIKAIQTEGTPPKLAARVVDFMMSTSGDNPEERMRKAQEKSRDLFVQASAEPEPEGEENERFGTSSRSTPQVTSSGDRSKALHQIKDPAAKMLAVASFQGEDYRAMLHRYLQSDSPDRITDADSPREIYAKIKSAQSFFEKQSDKYPKDVAAGLEDPATVFRVRVRHAVSSMNPEKAKALSWHLARMEADEYDKKQKDYERLLDWYERSKKAWEKNQKGKPPVAPLPPRKPPQYGLVRPAPNESEVREKRDKLLGVAKQASYSSYPFDRWQMPRLDGSNNGETRKVSTEHAEGNMTTKFAKEDANRILSRLDKMAEVIQAEHKNWGMPFEVAKNLVNGLDRTADEVEVAAFGPDSLQKRQAHVLKQAHVLQQDSDEKYMGTFNAPMAPLQTDSDEGYMSQFADDQSQAVQTGKSTTGRPLAP